MSLILDRIEQHEWVIRGLRPLEEDIQTIGQMLVTVVSGGGTIFFAGNGGSAAMAAHLAAELVGRFGKDRKPIAGLAFTDSTMITAIANDYGYVEVFSRSVAALVHVQDALVLLSTSGASPNVVRAAVAGQQVGVPTVALTGLAPNPLSDLCQFGVGVPINSTARIQEAHLLIGHIWCEMVEAACG